MAISPVVIDDFLAVLLLGNLAFLVLSGSARSLPRAGDRTGGFQMEGWTSARAASLRLPLLVPGQGRGRSGVCACMCACVFCVLSSEATYDLSLPPTPRHQEQYTVKFSLSLSLSFCLSFSVPWCSCVGSGPGSMAFCFCCHPLLAVTRAALILAPGRRSPEGSWPPPPTMTHQESSSWQRIEETWGSRASPGSDFNKAAGCGGVVPRGVCPDPKMGEGQTSYTARTWALKGEISLPRSIYSFSEVGQSRIVFCESDQAAPACLDPVCQEHSSLPQ